MAFESSMVIIRAAFIELMEDKGKCFVAKMFLALDNSLLSRSVLHGYIICFAVFKDRLIQRTCFLSNPLLMRPMLLITILGEYSLL